MAIEHACVRYVSKPWGLTDLRPFGDNGSGEPIGELWFTRFAGAPKPALLLKLLFTSEPLSIQVHPTDGYAASIGLPNGKSEAWYILAAAPNAKVAAGLKRRLSPTDLRAAIEDGSIVEIVHWRPVVTGDVISVPAGTIHAIGAGLVLAEIQQNSDATFRIFDFGRGRELHVDDAVAAANAGPAGPPALPYGLSQARTLLVASAFFVIERVNLAAGSSWSIDAEGETWLLVLDGDAGIGSLNAVTGQAVFLDAAQAMMTIGTSGLVGLLAYRATGPVRGLLREDRDRPSARSARPPAVHRLGRARASSPGIINRSVRS